MLVVTFLEVGASLAGSWWAPFVLAVGGPTKGRLFLARLVSCFWSLSSSKEVARLREAVLRSMVQYFCSGPCVQLGWWLFLVRDSS